MTTKSGFKKIQ